MKVSVGITCTVQLAVEVDDDLPPEELEVAVNNAILDRLPFNMELQTIDVIQPEGQPAQWAGEDEES